MIEHLENKYTNNDKSVRSTPERNAHSLRPPRANKPDASALPPHPSSAISQQPAEQRAASPRHAASGRDVRTK